MAKQSMIQRELKREKLIQQFRKKRKKLKSIISDFNVTDEIRWHAQINLQKLPVNSSPVRLTRRCQVTGRPHGVYRKFGLSRNILRQEAMNGNIPGLRKASW